MTVVKVGCSDNDVASSAISPENVQYKNNNKVMIQIKVMGMKYGYMLKLSTNTATTT